MTDIILRQNVMPGFGTQEMTVQEVGATQICYTTPLETNTLQTSLQLAYQLALSSYGISQLLLRGGQYATELAER
jgi:hypothetical protein